MTASGTETERAPLQAAATVTHSPQRRQRHRVAGQRHRHRRPRAAEHLRYRRVRSAGRRQLTPHLMPLTHADSVRHYLLTHLDALVTAAAIAAAAVLLALAIT